MSYRLLVLAFIAALVAAAYALGWTQGAAYVAMGGALLGR